MAAQLEKYCINGREYLLATWRIVLSSFQNSHVSEKNVVQRTDLLARIYTLIRRYGYANLVDDVL